MSLIIIPLSLIWPVIFILKLNESVELAPLKSAILPLLFTASISRKYCHNLPDVFELLSNYTLALLHQYL